MQDSESKLSSAAAALMLLPSPSVGALIHHSPVDFPDDLFVFFVARSVKADCWFCHENGSIEKSRVW
jgi:hypothetical protein